jgi:alkylhydroperoxidase/carboxymuconolactone decarboxylase family protein YurZ
MAISDAAAKNHEELFPGHVSTLKTTDPELVESFDNFAFDEVLRHGKLDSRTRLMVQLASMIACQAVGEYRVMLGAALTIGVTPVEVKEIVYQARPLRRHGQANLNGNGRDVLLAVITQLLPFIGYPRSLNALRVLNEVTSR